MSPLCCRALNGQRFRSWCRRETMLRVIARTLESLCALDYPRDQLEIIIIDDGSEDGTAAIVKELAGDDLLYSLPYQARELSGRGKAAALRIAAGRGFT